MSTPSPSLRERHADVTRRAILEAARRLFVELGYANTPIRRLAQEAGVAVPTIYATFGSKPGVLLALLDAMDQTMVEPIARRMMQEKDPSEQLGLVATLERRVREANGDLIRVVTAAAATDAEAAKVWQQGFDRHRQGVAQICGQLARGKHLRKGLRLEDAIATTLALTSLEAYDEAIGQRGWTHDRYEAWLARSLRHALLGA